MKMHFICDNEINSTEIGIEILIYNAPYWQKRLHSKYCHQDIHFVTFWRNVDIAKTFYGNFVKYLYLFTA